MVAIDAKPYTFKWAPITAALTFLKFKGAPLKVILRSMRIAKDVKISHDHPKEDLTNVRPREIVYRTLELTIQHTKLKEVVSCHQLK